MPWELLNNREPFVSSVVPVFHSLIETSGKVSDVAVRWGVLRRRKLVDMWPSPLVKKSVRVILQSEMSDAVGQLVGANLEKISIVSAF